MSHGTSPRSHARRHSRARRFVLPIILLLFAGLVVPGSPIYLPVLLNPSQNHTVRELIRALSDPDPAVRGQAAGDLGRLGTDAADSLPRLGEVLHQDPDPKVRAAAADAVGKMAPASRGVVGALGAALRDPDPLVRLNAALALLYLKEEARPAIPDLVAAVGDDDNDTDLDLQMITIRQVAFRALGTAAAGTGAAIPTCSDILSRSAPDVTRAIAARGLGLAGAHARDSAPLIRALLRDPNPDVRIEAEEALARIGADRNGPTRSGEFENLALPESELKRIWDIEHRGNVLNKYWFEPLAAALVRADAVELGRLFAPEFVGSETGAPTRVRSVGFVDVERLQESGNPPVPRTARQFVNRLLELRKVFGSAPQVKLVVATLKPKAPDDPDGVWEGKAQLRMHGVATPGAPAEVTATLAFEVRNPTASALATGGWLRAAHVQLLTVARSPHSLFAETAKARGLNTALHDNWTASSVTTTTGGVYVTDFDRDGYLDVLITDLTGNTLYRGGPGGNFTDATDRMGLPRSSSGAATAAAWVDLDGDGWEDLILEGRVYRNEGGTKFADYTARFSVRLPKYLSGILVADYDRDGKLDLYLTRTGPPGNLSWLEGRSNSALGNVLLRNLGDWKFEDTTKKSGTRGDFRSTFTAAWLDANDDGWPDLYVPNEFGDGVLLVNNRDGTFKPRALSDRPSDFGTMGLAVGDIDNDGRIDIYSANMYSKAGTRVIGNLEPDAYPPKVMEKLRRFVAGSQLHLNRGDFKFEQVGAEKHLAPVGWAYGAALADLDGDGLLDVYATAGYLSRDRRKPDG